MHDGQVLTTGRWLETDGTAKALVEIENVGRIEVQPSSRLALIRSRTGDHRLHLARGTVQAVIVSPPGHFSMSTPSSTAVDLGCVYTMTVGDDEVGLVQVTAGWVGFEWRGRESFIPAGASCVTRPRLGPGTPYYEDTSPAFRAALTTIDLGRSPAVERMAAIDLVLNESRPRDVVTLWHLLSRVDGADRDRVFIAWPPLCRRPQTCRATPYGTEAQRRSTRGGTRSISAPRRGGGRGRSSGVRNRRLQ